MSEDIYTQFGIDKSRLKRDYIENPLKKIKINTPTGYAIEKNGTFNTSKPEDEIYQLLCQKYGEVKRQYQSNLYPFRCDFYIPKIDTYIEYQGYFTHYIEPFDKNNLIHQEKVKFLKSKNNKLYLKFLKTWTESDPMKRAVAKKNNLNWIEFFTMDDFMKWLRIK